MQNEISEKANQLNMDYTGRCKNNKCLTCKHGCIDFEYILNGHCEHYSKRMTLNEIVREIKVQNINLRKLCADNGLKFGKMKEMLSNKLALSYRYYFALEKRILEVEEYVKYMERFADGEK